MKTVLMLLAVLVCAIPASAQRWAEADIVQGQPFSGASAVGLSLGGGTRLVQGLGVGLTYLRLDSGRKDRSVDLSGTFSWDVDPQTVITVDAGPTWATFDQAQPVVLATHVIPQAHGKPSKIVQDIGTHLVSVDGWGLHAGVSVAHALSAHLGVGASARVTQGQVAGESIGRVALGAGLRVRF